MYRRDLSQPFDARLEGRGCLAAGPEDGKPVSVSGDSPVRRPLIPQPLPGGVDGEAASEMRPRQNDPRVPDGVDTFNRMQNEAERHRRRAD